MRSDATGAAPPVCTVVAKRRFSIAEVGGELLGVAEVGKRHDAVDVLERQTGVRDGARRRLQLQAELGHARARLADVLGLADADDAGAIFEVEHRKTRCSRQDAERRQSDRIVAAGIALAACRVLARA